VVDGKATNTIPVKSDKKAKGTDEKKGGWDRHFVGVGFGQEGGVRKIPDLNTEERPSQPN